MLLVDPRPMTRQSLRLGLASVAPDLQIIACADIPSEAGGDIGVGALVSIARLAACESVIADIERFHHLLGNVPIVLIAASDHPADIALALEHGVRGYITLDMELGIAVKAIRLVCAGGVYVPASSLLHPF